MGIWACLILEIPSGPSLPRPRHTLAIQSSAEAIWPSAMMNWYLSLKVDYGKGLRFSSSKIQTPIGRATKPGYNGMLFSCVTTFFWKNKCFRPQKQNLYYKVLWAGIRA